MSNNENLSTIESVQDYGMRVAHWIREWQPTVESWVREQMSGADSGHGIDHVRRVVENSLRLGAAEHAQAEIYLPAAWLHDCVSVPKNSPQRSLASTLAAQAAENFLKEINYPTQWIQPTYHCIQSHSFTANVPCQTIEAKVVQDADRLEAVGAIGLARCLMTGGSMRQRLYHPDSPFPGDREPKDTEQSVDHFFAKLLGLKKTMQTEAGRMEAERRTEFLVAFLKQLASEIGRPISELEEALRKHQ